jgi:hypothetical protein
MDRDFIEKFAALYSEIEAFRPTYESAMRCRDAELTRRTGIPSHWTLRTEDEAKRVMAVQAVIDDEIGFGNLNEKMETLWERLDPVVRTITRAPARDIADLALKANATATAWGSLWERNPEELDHEHELIRDLIESVCAVAGVNIAANQRAASRSDLN